MNRIKYKTKYILILLILTILLNNNIAFAATISTNDSTWIFNGDIIQKYNFMIGDIPTSDDFIITGTISNDINTLDINDYIVCVQPNKIKSIGNNDIYVDFKTKDYKYCFTQKFVVKAVDFNTSMICNINQHQINIKNTVIYSDDGIDHIEYYKTLNIFMYNLYGKRLDGYFNCNDDLYNPHIGYNLINYTFVPFDDRYGNAYGDFIVYYDNTPEITSSKTGIKFNINNSDKRYKIKINDKWYTATTIKKLKSNTNYIVKIYQKANNYLKEDTLLYTTSVKTK